MHIAENYHKEHNSMLFDMLNNPEIWNSFQIICMFWI